MSYSFKVYLSHESISEILYFYFSCSKAISIKDVTSFNYLDFRNELHSSRPFKQLITLAGWVFLYRLGKMGQKIGKERVNNSLLLE